MLDRLIAERGRPQGLVLDNGPEFASRAMDAWAYRRGVRLDFIRPGRPIENCFVESFNGRFRDKRLNQPDQNPENTPQRAWRFSPRRTIEAWRHDYNRVRPHSALGCRPPREVAQEAALRSLDATSAPLKDRKNDQVTLSQIARR